MPERRRSRLPHFLAALYGLAIVYASLQPFANWVGPAPGTPFFLFAPWPTRWTRFDVLANVLAYAPFYFPGSYPGAGARFYADVLPLEHGLLALALVRLGIARFAPAAMLFGFSLHAVHEHVALAEREGGRPMFSASALAGPSIMMRPLSRI